MTSGDTGSFSAHTDCPGTLAPGASCTFTVTYAPIAPDEVHLHVVISADPGGSVAIDATGTAIGAVTLTVPPQKPVVVRSLPEGIDCGETCAADFPMGSEVELTATTGSSATSILGWRGDCAGIDSCADPATTCTLTLAQSCQAAPIVGADLTLKRSGSGVITSDPPGILCGGPGPIACDEDAASFEINSTVVLTASQRPVTTAPSFHNAVWTGCMETSGPTCTVAMPATGAVVEYSCTPSCPAEPGGSTDTGCGLMQMCPFIQVP